MTTNEARRETAIPAAVSGRYLVQGVLGRGGMATVYDVLDTLRGGRYALKSLALPARADRRAAIVTLFEREFLTLSQLQHPNVVRVFDYGMDETAPYYTMEFVAGDELHSRVPLPWPAACAIARDLCSVLALLHSRRLIYRDLNPRNVRSTVDGSTKLIDFGAMCAMGPNRQLVGTPAFCAPEALHFQPLDGRTDLYALGVMLYMMLTGRVPFYVKDFAQMRAQPLSQPPLPSELAPEIPSALEQLVLALMRSDPALRPANASEVIDRLSGIAGLASDERLLVPHAYLSTPNLVGRADALAAFRAGIVAISSGHGASMVLRGPSGSGRTRVLAACELEAKLLGIAVVRPDTAEIGSSQYAAARAIILQLLELAPEMVLRLLWPHASVLVHVVPELRERVDGIVAMSIDAEHMDRSVQPLLRQVFIEIGRRQPLMIAVDDAERIDPGSAAMFALLAQELETNAIVLVTTLESADRAPPEVRDSLEVLVEASQVIALEPLAADATESLLGSVFGDVPNLRVLAHRLQAISCGNPRDLMQLAQHLVDQAVVRYRNGSWTIPDNMEALELPSGMAQALHQRMNMLAPQSRALAQTMGEGPGQRFTFDECVVLAEAATREHVMQSLDELLAAGVLRLDGGLFALAQDAWIATLSGALSPSEARACNLKLAALFASRGDDFRSAQQLLRAAETQRGLDLLIAHATSSRARTDRDAEAFLALLRGLPDDWLATYEQALRLCAELGRPYAETYALRSRLCGLAGATSVNAMLHFEALIVDLSRACGLDLYAATSAELPVSERLKSALLAARARYERTPPAERGEDPGVALRELARVVIQASGLIALGLDYGLATRMPSLEPLAPLSPALQVVDKLVLGVAARISGKTQLALEIYAAVLERLAEADRAGLDPAHHLYTVPGVECGSGMLEAAIGLESCLAYAVHMEDHPQHQVNAVLMRMLHAIWQGRQADARQLKHDAELIRIQNRQRRVFAGAHLLGELTGYAVAGELTGVKQIADAVERQARAFPGWVPVLHYARGEYHRLCGNAAAALAELTTALSSIQPGTHQIWVWAAAAQLRTLLDLGRAREAKESGVQYLESTQARQLGYTCIYVRMPFALALSQLDEHAEAEAQAQACLDELAALGATGLNASLALETRAVVALRAGDRRIFDDCLEQLARASRDGSASSLVACHDRVVKEARKLGLLSREEVAEAQSAVEATSQLVRSTLETCDTLANMARASLELLMRSTGSPGGLFYRVEPKGLALEAKLGTLESSAQLERFAGDFLATELRQEQSTMVEDESSTATPSAMNSSVSANLCPVAVSHLEGARYTVVAVVLLDRARSLAVPTGLVTELSRVLFGAGVMGMSSQ